MVYPALNNQIPRSVVIGNSTRGPYTLQDVSGTSIRVRLGSHLEIRRYSSTTDETGTALVLNTDFTIINTNIDSVTITLTSAQEVLTSSQRLVIARKQTIPDVLSLAQGANFSGPALADAISVVTERVQELRSEMNRTVKTDWRETTERALPLPPTSGSAYLYRNTDGSIGQGAALTLSDADPSWSDVLSGDVPFVYPAGAVGDGVYGYSGVATAASTTFTASAAAFVAADVGKVIIIQDAGALRRRATTATVSAGGTGYAVGDMITPAGGTSALAAEYRVNEISGGGATGPVVTVSVRCPGIYTTMPSNPAATTGGTGTGCTLTLSSSTYNLPHRTTIAGVNSPTSITLTDAPTTSVASNANYLYGTDDTTALQTTLNSLGFMGAMALSPGKTYCYSNLTLPTNTISGFFYSSRSAIVSIGGTAGLACIGGGSTAYGIAPDRWLTGASGGTFTSSPWLFENIVFDAQGQVDRNVVYKNFNCYSRNCWFRGGLIADVELTRQNQDGSDGTSSYQSDNEWANCRFDGSLAVYQMRSLGDTTGLTDSSTDGTITDCVFYGRDSATWGLYLGNGGGWIVSRNRFYSHKIAGSYVSQISRGLVWSDNNMDGDETNATPALIVGATGVYRGGSIGPGNRWYTNLICDFKADTSTERIIVRGDDFFTKIAGTPDAQVVHNNNRTEKTLVIEDCSSEASSIYVRATGNTAGQIVVDNVDQYSSATLPAVALLYDEPGAAVGPIVSWVRRSASPAPGDILASHIVYGDDSAGNVTTYGGWRVTIGTTTDGAEDGILHLQAMRGGSYTDRFIIGAGMYYPGASDPGNNNVNVATGYYLAGALAIDANAGIRHPSFTSTSLNAIANAVNTANKAAGKTVWNSTASKLVSAVGSTAASVWVDGAGTTVNTPV